MVFVLTVWLLGLIWGCFLGWVLFCFFVGVCLTEGCVYFGDFMHVIVIV